MANVNKLPDAYNKSTSGNNFKLLNLNEQAVTELNEDITAVFNCLDLQQATGKTLDLYGNMLGQKRGALTDTQYRSMIYSKIGRNICKGDHSSIVKVISQILNCNPSDISITDGDENCRVKIVKLPYEILSSAGFSGSQIITLIEMILPICVKVSDANFEGTFELGDTSLEFDNEKGLADIEQTIGGYFGLLIADRNIFELPL